MAGMNGAGMATAIKNGITGIVGTPSFDKVWNAIGAAIVAYIQANAVITVTGTATGVTAGAASVPVTGTATIA